MRQGVSKIGWLIGAMSMLLMMIGEVKAEIHGLRGEVKAEIHGLRAEMTANMTRLDERLTIALDLRERIVAIEAKLRN